jgi:hypothetical protein
MHITDLLATPVDIGWKVLSALTILSMIDMTRQVARRTRHLHA